MFIDLEFLFIFPKLKILLFIVVHICVIVVACVIFFNSCKFRLLRVSQRLTPMTFWEYGSRIFCFNQLLETGVFRKRWMTKIFHFNGVLKLNIWCWKYDKYLFSLITWSENLFHSYSKFLILSSFIILRTYVWKMLLFCRSNC